MTQLGMIEPAQAAKARAAAQDPEAAQSAATTRGSSTASSAIQEDERLAKTREGRTRRLFEGGLRIHTTLDRTCSARPRKRWPTGGPRAGPTSPWSPSTRVTAASGRWSAAATSRRGYNAALQGVGRQPGSSFKTFVLAAGAGGRHLAGLGLGVERLPGPVVCGSPGRSTTTRAAWSGPVSVRDATRRSVNGVYARLVEKVCPDKVAEMAERGWRLPDPPGKRVPAMALGLIEVRRSTWPAPTPPGRPGRVQQADLLRGRSDHRTASR